MKLFNYLIITLLLLSSTFCEKDTEAKEFEENEISTDYQLFNFKANKPSLIILILKNENISQNSQDIRTLTAYNKVTKKSSDFRLYFFNYVILEDAENEESAEYILKFKNYEGGKFIIYNSANAYPLKNLENPFNMKYYFSSGYRDVDLTFTTEILKNDALIDVYPGENMKIMKISETGAEEPLEIINNSAQLSKDSKYKIEFNENIKIFEVAIKKREVINYKINDELKLNLFYKIPFFFLLNISEYNNEIIYTYMYCLESSKYNISIFELESENIDNWDKIDLNINSKILSSKDINEINITNLAKPYLLIKYTLSNYNDRTIHRYFYTFKVFEYFKKFTTSLNTQKEKETLMILEDSSNYMKFVTSNISNLRTFEDKESKSLIYQKALNYFAFIIIPTKEDFKITSFSIGKGLNENIFLKEIFFFNNLNLLFSTILNKQVWYFDINDNYTFIAKSFYGFPKIYYFDEEINEKIINDMNDGNLEKYKQINTSNNIMNFNSPFALYIDPFESSYLNILFNKDDNLNILKETANKYLIENKEYKLLLAPSKIMIRIDKDFDSNITISNNDEIIYTLNKENTKIEMEFLSDDYILKSGKNTIINFYYNISDLFFDEPKEIITFPPERKGEIMIVKILSYESNYEYAMDYGYNYYISPNTQKKSTTQTYFFIEDPYSQILNRSQDLRYYLILFNKNIKYEISYKKQYEKIYNSSFYLVESDKDHAIVSELNYPSSYFIYEVLLCENKNINITMMNINNKTETITTNKLIIKQNKIKTLFTFEAKSKFLFLQKENYGYQYDECEIKYYIPNIEDEKISFLILNNFFDYNNKYTFLFVEENNDDDKLMNNLDNECYLFSLINGEIPNINYTIEKYSAPDIRYFFTEVNITKFSNSKYLLIKIFSCENEANICVFSKTKKIYLEDMKKDEEEEFGIKKVKEFIEYNVTRQDYIFSYDYKPYINNIEDIMIYVTVPTTTMNYVGELEIINPLMQNFTFRYRYTETIPLIKGQHVISRGRYYFIFRNCTGVSFYVHNTMNFFPLNKINNYISETDHRISNGDGMLYFTMSLDEDRYVFFEHNTGDMYLYNITQKVLKNLNWVEYHAYKINKGSYILILKLRDSSSYQNMININHYIVNLEKSKEVKVEIGTKWITEPTVAAVVDLSKHNKSLYLVSDSINLRVISCEESMDIENIIKNGWSGYNKIDSHIEKIEDEKKCDPPYYNIKFYTTRFELVSDVYTYNTSQNLSFKQNDTIAFTIEGNGYNLILSNQENMKWLDQMETEFVNVILSNEQIQFKLKPNENIQTDLQIIILENEKKIKIENLTNQEISTRIDYENENKEIKYYINLSKNKYLINHFDYIGKLEFYISKEEINGNNLKHILNEDDINLDLFDKVINDYFELDNNKILIMKKENEILSELLITPLNHDFILENTDSKYLIANKRYFIRSYIKILIDENSDAKIKVYDLNNTEIYTIDKNNSFENIDYNKLLFIKSDKDVLIYIYHYLEENLNCFEVPKNINNSLLILFRSDCENNDLKYGLDIGFKNYSSSNLELMEIYESKEIIHFEENKKKKIQKGVNDIIYIQCENNAKFLVNSSGFYENSTSSVGNGSNIIEKNKDIFIQNILDDYRKNIFYQIFECEPKTISNNELYASIDDNKLTKLDENDNFINGDNEINFYFKTKNELLFNYHKTSSNKEIYESKEKYDNPHFNISYISKNKTKIDILPKYEDIDFEFYFFMIIDKENKILNNPLKNKCYMKKLLNNEQSKLLDENIIIKKIEYKNGEIINNIIETPNLEKGFIIYSNIFGSGNVLEDAEEYIFYAEQNHIIVDSDFPSDNPSDNGGLTVGAIIGIVIGGIALILIIVLLILKLRKKDSMDLENVNKYSPLTVEKQN